MPYNKLTPVIDSKETDLSGFDAAIPDTHYRLINENGTFNIEREGNVASSLFAQSLTMSWTKFIGYALLFYFSINGLFALGFMFIGVESITNLNPGTWFQEFIQYLFFCIETFTTVGYGHNSPNGTAANILASFVSFVGLLSFAIATGLSYAKFSRPTSDIKFSKNMLIAPNKNGEKSLQFRIVNTNNNHIFDMEARVTLAWLENVDGRLRRRFKWLDLEIENIHLFPLNWTIVHPINSESPLFDLDKQDMATSRMEILILIKGFDATYTKTIHSKHSYNCINLIENAQFIPMYKNKNGRTVLDLSQLNSYEEYSFKK
ncbi:MAG: ion channel [Saprospiraceae bacterium]